MVSVKVISKEIVKPSSPTPNHLYHYQFSFLDQITPPIYTSLVLFYEFNDNIQPEPAAAVISIISKHLKKSLSEVLTLFYPLAGRVKIDNHLVQCNDEGIPYLEAQVTNCRLRDFQQNSMPGELCKLIPFELRDHENSEFALGVQLNIFECGGYAIGLCISHKLADGLSMIMFTKTWAAINRGENETKIECPEFVSAAVFPPADDVSGYRMFGVIPKNKVTKRFVFNARTIEHLREKYTGLAEDDREKRPSRVEALSAFLWRRFVEASKDDHSIDENIFHAAVHTVNLRPRTDPPIPRCSFGNFYQIFLTTPFVSSSSSSSGIDDQESCHDMVKQVREELSKIDKDHVKRLQKGGHGSYINRFIQRLAKPGKPVTLSYSSLCSFPLYDIDFGWGRPTWVAVPPLPFKNLIVLADTEEAGGIEAYVSLADDDAMTKFESHAFIKRRVGINQDGSVGSNITGHRPKL
ncbi:vinorine synthase-like [Pyrus ussuriensis x Pyrus communis]|uniref:Vinorine synthase-like n=1 Tax=Pyrus ussuriensis x Pyrus communis TaxID=2448454 RepID=A0A5N5FGF1_9ROSA|nr:vinorine synthase-like [Pyrus ussuriensis x Pyrus communis]